MSMYTNMHRQFSARTKANLDFIDKAKSEGSEDVYESTQLINSLLGMIILLKEWKHIPYQDTHEFCKDLKFTVIEDKCEDCKTINDFVRKFRNALAHGNFTIIGKTQIESLELWNINRDKVIDWKINIDLENIRTLAFALTKHVSETV